MTFTSVPRDWETIEPKRRWRSPDRRFVLYRLNGNSGPWVLFDRDSWEGSVTISTGQVNVRQVERCHDRLSDALKHYERARQVPHTNYASEAEARAHWEGVAAGGVHMTPAFRAYVLNES